VFGIWGGTKISECANAPEDDLAQARIALAKSGWGWAEAPRASNPVEALADENIHRDVAVLCLAFGGVVACRP
jgi:hypothetical protein